MVKAITAVLVEREIESQQDVIRVYLTFSFSRQGISLYDNGTKTVLSEHGRLSRSALLAWAIWANYMPGD